LPQAQAASLKSGSAQPILTEAIRTVEWGIPRYKPCSLASILIDTGYGPPVMYLTCKCIAV